MGFSEVWLDGFGDFLFGDDMCFVFYFVFIMVYGDIKEWLGGLERENVIL